MARVPAALSLVLLVAAGSACASRSDARGRARGAATAVSAPPAAVSASAQTLGSGDVFEARVVGEEDVSGDYRVASDGSVSFPFCGRVELGGMTATQAAEALTACLADGYIKNPQVTVFLKERNSKKVYVFGEVQKPGTFVFEDGMNVVQAVTLAEGFSKLAARNAVVVTRLVEGKERRYKIRVDDIGTGRSENFPLLPGDIVYVPESFF